MPAYEPWNVERANALIAEMVAAGEITAEERGRMLLLSYPRRRSEVLAPFAESGRFGGLLLEQSEIFQVPDAAWGEYERDRDKGKLAANYAGFFRATFMPSLASALAPERGAESRRRFIDRLAEGLKRQLTEEPAPLSLQAQTIVIAKEGEA